MGLGWHLGRFGKYLWGVWEGAEKVTYCAGVGLDGCEESG